MRVKRSDPQKIRTLLPSDTKILLTKNYSKISIFGKITNLTRNSLGNVFLPWTFREDKMTQKLRKNNSQGIIFVIISCQRVHFLELQLPWPGTGVLCGKSLKVLWEVLLGVLWCSWGCSSCETPHIGHLWVRIFSGGLGVFHVLGWGPKSSVCPSKPGKSNLLGGIFPGILPGYPGGARKVWERKVCVKFLAPILAKKIKTF